MTDAIRRLHSNFGSFRLPPHRSIFQSDSSSSLPLGPRVRFIMIKSSSHHASFRRKYPSLSASPCNFKYMRSFKLEVRSSPSARWETLTVPQVSRTQRADYHSRALVSHSTTGPISLIELRRGT